MGFEVEASVYSAIVSAVLRGALLVDLTPTDRYTVALGAVTSYGGGDDDILGYARVNANGSGLGYGANFYVGYARY